MNCPIDGAELLITYRQNVEIDYCPQCRGVWLDRGELDKIIEHSVEKFPDERTDRGYRDERRQDTDDDYRVEKREKQRRKSFLEEFFDF